MNADTDDIKRAQWKRIAEIEDQLGEKITPHALVEDAKREDSPFHGEFDWNVQKAAQAHWEAVARDIIRTIRPVREIIEEGTVSRIRLSQAPIFVRDPDAPAGEQCYIRTESLKSDPDKAHRVLCNDFVRIAGMLRRVYAIAEELNMAADVQPLMEQFSITRHKFEAPESRQ